MMVAVSSLNRQVSSLKKTGVVPVVKNLSEVKVIVKSLNKSSVTSSPSTVTPADADGVHLPVPLVSKVVTRCSCEGLASSFLQEGNRNKMATMAQVRQVFMGFNYVVLNYLTCGLGNSYGPGQ